jgi:hypothetical protein
MVIHHDTLRTSKQGRRQMNTYGFELVRSDAGDGGWSLHAPELEDEDGWSPVLVSGPAEWDCPPDDYGDWNRPNQADYDAAYARLAPRRAAAAAR